VVRTVENVLAFHMARYGIGFVAAAKRWEPGVRLDERRKNQRNCPPAN
jgi:hypothetical protein